MKKLFLIACVFLSVAGTGQTSVLNSKIVNVQQALRLMPASTPSSLLNGQVWYNGTGLKFRTGSVTHDLLHTVPTLQATLGAGSTLTSGHNVTLGSNVLTFTGTPTMGNYMTSYSGTGFGTTLSTSASTGYAFNANATDGVAVLAVSSNGTALHNITNNGLNAHFIMSNEFNNTAPIVAQYQRLNSGISAAGLGMTVQYAIQNNAGNVRMAGQQQFLWNSSVNNSENSVYRLRGLHNNTEYTLMEMRGDGVMLLPRLNDNTGVDKVLQINNGVVTVGTGTGGGSSVTTDRQVITATAGQTVFGFTSVPASYNDYSIARNGVLLRPVTDYTTSGNNVTTTFATDAGDVIEYHRTK